MTNILSHSLRRLALRAAMVAGAAVAVQGCTDLDESPQDALTPETAFKTDPEIRAGLASVYAQLRSTQWTYYNLSSITTDEQVVPTRGSDWFDNGRWLEIHRHTWTASSGSAAEDMNGLWTAMFGGVAKANLMIDIVTQSTSPTKEATLAELRTLRAWYYYVLMDMFGGVPLVTAAQAEPSPRVTRDSVFKFIESELKTARTTLPDKGKTDYGRMTKGVADAILANMYINAPVFQGTVTAAGLTPAAPRYQEAIEAADRVINSGLYSLASDYRANFSTTNEASPENIFVIVNSSVPGLGESFPMRVLHYNSIAVSGGAWNGFATLAETYRSFDPADQRRSVFLVGQQTSFNTGQPITDRAGAPLVFTDTIADVTKASENEGARLLKFPPLPSAPNGDSHPNDFPYFRLGEMFMIKAEALVGLGRTGEGIALINQLRQRAFATPKPIAVGTADAARTAILNERLFEFVGEAKRRQDLIRLGGFTAARRFKPMSEPYKVLFPIPSQQIANNPLLTQNPGY